MKKIALILFLLFSLCVPVYAVDFVEVGGTDLAQVYVDADSIEQRTSSNHEYVVAWVKIIPGGKLLDVLYDRYQQPVDCLLQFYAFNKNTKQIQLLSDRVYNTYNIIIYKKTMLFQISNYDEVVPGSNAEFVYNFVMKPKK